MLFCFLLFSFATPETALITGTEVYQPLNRSETIVRPDGHVYVLCFQESRILEFDANGTKIRTIGAKGKGPGEFTYSGNFFFMGNKLYVFDILNGEISVFDADGTFESRIKTQKQGIQLCKTETGWIYFTQMLMNPDDKIEVVWVDELFQNPVAIIEFDNPGYSQGLMVMNNGTETVARFSPLSASPTFFATPDGHQVFLSHGEESTIYVINDQQKKIVQTLNLEVKRVPFDTEWAEERLAEVKERSKGQFSAKIETHFPDRFPAFRDMIAIPGGGIALNRWAGKPDEKNYPVFIDVNGKTITSTLDWETLDRLAGIHDNQAWITYWNQEEDFAGLACVPLEHANQYVKEHPIEFEGRAGRSISISN